MTTPVTYAFGGTLGGSGIGRIAGHAVAGGARASLLNQAVAMGSDLKSLPSGEIETIPFGSYVTRIPNYYVKDTIFDSLSARHVDSPELFHGWNNMCLRSLRKANESGAVTVVERASTHPAVQRDLVEAEFKQFGVEKSLYNKRQFRRSVTELAEADCVFVPSEFVYDSFLDQGFHANDLRLIPFGVDVEAFTPPENLARTEQEFTALFVGQVSLRKGVQYLLPAWKQADVDGTLKIAGQVTSDAEPIVDEYRDDPSIEFLGWVDDMAEEYRRASVFVFPSLEEGSALVSYEAMAAGLPSIVTPNAGSLVRNEEEGLIISPQDVKSIVSALKRLEKEPKTRAAFGQSARTRINDYTWERYGDAVARMYDELLA